MGYSMAGGASITRFLLNGLMYRTILAIYCVLMAYVAFEYVETHLD
jgi:hypothetical protein